MTSPRIKKFEKALFVFLTRFLTPHNSQVPERTRDRKEIKTGEIMPMSEIEADLVRVLANARASGLRIKITPETTYPSPMGDYPDHIEIRESSEVIRMIMARNISEDRAA